MKTLKFMNNSELINDFFSDYLYYINLKNLKTIFNF